MIWSTYLHGTDRDDVYGVRVDTNGFVYAVGWTQSSNFPTTAGAYDRTHNGDMDVFITKLEPDGSSLVYSTFFGGSPDNGYEPSGLSIDLQGNVSLSGSIFGNIANHPTTSDAFQRTSGGQNEAFFAVLSPELSKLRYSSHFGGSGHDRIRDLVHSSSGELVFGGDTYSKDLPVTDLTFQTNYRGAGDAYIARSKAAKLPADDVYDDDTVNFPDAL
jgi:hypothetical protein